MTKEERKEYNRLYQIKNKEKIKEKAKVYESINKEKRNQNSRDRYNNNKEYYYNWRDENREHVNELRRERSREKYNTDPLYKATTNVRSLLNHSFRNEGYTKRSKTSDILGCSFEEFVAHLNNNEYGFIYGDNDLDLDHIIPISSATTEEELIKLNHYTNFQLLPSDYNRGVKSDSEWNKQEFELA